MTRPQTTIGFPLISLFVGSLSVVAGCAPVSDDGGDEGEGEEGEGELACTEPTEPECQDASFQDLAMSDNASTRTILDTVAGGVHEVEVDSTAGGFNGTDGFIYGKFTDDGFVKVDIADFDSFASMDWDIGFRRYVVRLNSGVSGPSCVAAANLGDDAFESITALPSGAEFRVEEYMDDTCALIPDGSGLPTSPGTAMQNYWTYPGCVAMTHNIYAISLADGRTVKIEMQRYYLPEAAQDLCDEDGELANNAVGGNIRFRWAWL
jgi:hypothetical protein